MHEAELRNQDSDSSQQSLIYYDEDMSMLERTAYRVYPIVKEVASRMVSSLDAKEEQAREKRRTDSLENLSVNMKGLLGYLNQQEWLYLLNIGNIMQITPLTIHDFYSEQAVDVELCRDSVLEKISYLAISYFCVSTELRFLVSGKEKLKINMH